MAKWTPEQRRNARIVVQRGKRAKATEKQIEAALETILVEANAGNPKHGDRDSLGAFQQRATWGSAKSRLNVAESADRFFREAKKVKQSGSSGQLAQRVQRSAFPDRYEQRDSDAASLARAAGVTLRGGEKSSPDLTPDTDSSFTTKRLVREGGGTDTKGAVVAALLQGGKNIMANLNRNLTSGEFDIPETTREVNKTTTVKAQTHHESSGTAAPRSNAKGGPVIRELFYDPIGGWDEGQRIAPIGGHVDHVHVAARSPGAARAIARRAQKMGLTVRELEPFDKVDPVHTKGSFHYSDKAFDASGDPKKMAELTNWIRERYGLS